uniref:Apoptosis inhibitor 5 n=2 Tax=Suricata suricatta TaxID=37032 RepID=A0A673UGL7_SURSU
MDDGRSFKEQKRTSVFSSTPQQELLARHNPSKESELNHLCRFLHRQALEGARTINCASALNEGRSRRASLYVNVGGGAALSAVTGGGTGGSWRRNSAGRGLGELQRRRWRRRRRGQQERALGLSLTMPTVEELYRNYGILADATEQVGQHKDAYQVILDGVKGGTKEKRLAAQFIPKFFKHFPELADSAINAQLDLCEDEDVSIRRQAIKELPQFATGENLPRVADILTQLLQTDDSAEFNLVNNALLSIFKMDAKGTLGGLFSQILQGEDIVRERAIKFLSTKLKTLPDEVLTKEVEELILTESKKVLEDVTGEEFVLFMKILSGLKSLQTVSGRQQLVELVAEQADLEQTFNPSDPDCVDRLLQCTRQAVPLFSKNVHSTRFVTYFCEQVLPNLSSLTTPVEGLDIQLEVLKLLAEMSSFCGDMEKLETNLRKLFDKLLEYMPLPPEEAENGENAGSEEPKLQFSYVECLLYSFHQLGRKLPDFLTAKLNAEKLKDFKIRLQYFARGLQVYIRQLRLALQGKTGEALKTEENKIKVVALKITNNINVLIKDLFHIPPSYKSTVTLSWKPVQKVEIGQKRANEDTTSGSPPKKSPAGPKRDARQIYNPPSGKYSSNLSNFNYEQRGAFRGSRGGRGWGARGNRSRGRLY